MSVGWHFNAAVNPGMVPMPLCRKSEWRAMQPSVKA
jgi:hypothetical protein